MVTPLRAVLSAVEAGATTQADITSRTSLSPDVVSAAVEHLQRIGRVTGLRLGSGCPTGGCSGCAELGARRGLSRVDTGARGCQVAVAHFAGALTKE